MQFSLLLIYLIVLLYVRCDDEITLTTATVRQSTSPKPTTLYRRIMVERNFDEKSSTPLDLSSLRDHSMRRSQSKIWEWDFWCQLQPKRGTCSSNLIKFYYDAQLDKCLSFTYSGCKGNKNNFDTLVDCERHCKGAALMPIRDHGEVLACSLQWHYGTCLAFMNRYYYDVNNKTCRKFIYGGCGGNQNNFVTKAKCMHMCWDKKK